MNTPAYKCSFCGKGHSQVEMLTTFSAVNIVANWEHEVLENATCDQCLGLMMGGLAITKPDLFEKLVADAREGALPD